MNNISEKHKMSLQSLIYSDDFENVIQGLELLDTLAEDEKDVYFVFDFNNKNPTSIEELEASLSNVKHRNYINLWILGKLAEVGVDWVIDITWMNCDGDLEHIPNSFQHLTNLTKLDIRFNEFSVLPKVLGRLPNLKDIEIDCSSIKEWPDTYEGFTKLESLSLIGNELSALPGFVMELKNLKKLILTENNLTTLPQSIEKLTSLEYIDLTDNKISSIPSTIAILPNLSEVSLEWNILSNLAEDDLEELFQIISSIPHLWSLDISGNDFTQLPKSFWNITDISYLYISRNKLQITANDIKQRMKNPDLIVEI
jgi:Leucine-rich repeat (LRR) protein